MEYTIKAHPTMYNGVMFRSRLEATWAAFFDLMGFKWEYEPIDLDGWVPDFYVDYVVVGYRHRLYVEVKPFRDVKEFEGTKVDLAEKRFYQITRALTDEEWEKRCESFIYPAKFGLNPDATLWMEGRDALKPWFEHDEKLWPWKREYPIGYVDDKWNQAQNLTRWRPQ
jgi:hypothetical protein